MSRQCLTVLARASSGLELALGLVRRTFSYR